MKRVLAKWPIPDEDGRPRGTRITRSISEYTRLSSSITTSVASQIAQRTSYALIFSFSNTVTAGA